MVTRTIWEAASTWSGDYVGDDLERPPSWVTWQQRPFPDANLLFLPGRNPALADSGFVGHAAQTADWVHARTGQLALVVNTHWHADHVGSKGILQVRDAGIAASVPDADAVAHRDPGCPAASRGLDQPVGPHVGRRRAPARRCAQIAAPSVTPSGRSSPLPGTRRAICACGSPTNGSSCVGDALSDYDVGWVNIALDGPGAAATALASLQRLIDLAPRVLIPAHGPIAAGTAFALTAAKRRAQRLVDDPGGAVWYGARRIFAYALMIHGGLPTAEVEPYLH